MNIFAYYGPRQTFAQVISEQNFGEYISQRYQDQSKMRQAWVVRRGLGWGDELRGLPERSWTN